MRASIYPQVGWLDWRVQEPPQEEDDGGWGSLECLDGGKNQKVEAVLARRRLPKCNTIMIALDAQRPGFFIRAWVEGIANIAAHDGPRRVG